MSLTKATLTVLGLDPSHRNTGVFLGKATVAPNAKPLLIPYEDGASIATVHTHRPEKKFKGYVNVHDVNEGAAALWELVQIIRDYSVDVIFCETPVGSKSASAMKGYGVCVGWISAIKVMFPHVKFLHMRAQDLKRGLTGDPNADKATMVRTAVSLVPTAGWKMLNRTDKVTGAKQLIPSVASNEHAADAFAAAFVGINSSEFTQLVINQRSNS